MTAVMKMPGDDEAGKLLCSDVLIFTRQQQQQQQQWSQSDADWCPEAVMGVFHGPVDVTIGRTHPVHLHGINNDRTLTAAATASTAPSIRAADNPLSMLISSGRRISCR